jgi:hypothetical protein
VQIDSVTGAQHVDLTVPSEGWIALQDQNTIVYADFGGRLSLLRANLTTGQTQTITNFQFPEPLVGVAIYAPVPEPSSLGLVFTALANVAVFSRVVSIRRRRRS